MSPRVHRGEYIARSKQPGSSMHARHSGYQFSEENRNPTSGAGMLPSPSGKNAPLGKSFPQLGSQLERANPDFPSPMARENEVLAQWFGGRIFSRFILPLLVVRYGRPRMQLPEACTSSIWSSGIGIPCVLALLGLIADRTTMIEYETVIDWTLLRGTCCGG